MYRKLYVQTDDHHLRTPWLSQSEWLDRRLYLQLLETGKGGKSIGSVQKARALQQWPRPPHPGGLASPDRGGVIQRTDAYARQTG